MITSFIVVELLPDGESDSAEVAAESITVDTNGLLRFYRGTTVVGAYAPGRWASVVPYGEEADCGETVGEPPKSEDDADAIKALIYSMIRVVEEPLRGMSDTYLARAVANAEDIEATPHADGWTIISGTHQLHVYHDGELFLHIGADEGNLIFTLMQQSQAFSFSAVIGLTLLEGLQTLIDTAVEEEAEGTAV